MTDEHREEEKTPSTDSEQGGKGEEVKETGVRDREPASGDAAASVPGAEVPEAPPDTSPHPFEALLDEYPLREPSADPVWSVRIVKGWMYFLAFNFAWMFLFMILGLFFP